MNAPSILEKIIYKIEDYTNDIDLKNIYIGNDTFRQFSSHFDFTSFFDSLYTHDYIDSILSPDTLIVLGPVNLNQVPIIQKLYEDLKGERKFLFHIQGSLDQKILKKSYFAVTDLSEHVKVDYVYNNYPFELKTMMQEMKSLKRKTSE